ncbi:MAG: membrane associated [Prolixibacteraceae bacterium]|nr:MAG: membrane associated [Prolixibacteraceae bacterium]
MKIAANLILFVFLFVFNIKGQEPAKKIYQAEKTDGLNITIDGILNEPEWDAAHWEDQFIQHQPNEGKAPYQKTEFAILYDENNIYVALKSYDSSPDSISYRLTRRDVMDGDMAGIIFDSYYDKRTGFAFFVSAAGVKNDILFSNDGTNEDNTWDPIWWVKTCKTVEGWNAEMRIPLSQLRFEAGADQLWGLNVIRYIFRKDEISSWQLMEREKAGFTSQFGTLTGIREIQPMNTFDVTPYVVARTERFEKVPANPFRATGKIAAVNAFWPG